MAGVEKALVLWNEEAMSVLIVGGDSLIGRSVAETLRRRDVGCLASTRRPEQAGPQRPLIDLSRPSVDWTPPAGIRAALLCAARPSQQDCADHPDETRAVNVEAVLALGVNLSRAGIFTIFLSTSLVFDGKQPRMPANAPYRPIGAYGMQKVEAEQGLQAMFPTDRLAIVRLGKVLDPGAALLRDWRTALSESRRIEPFDDIAIAPLSPSFTADALSRILLAGKGGVFQLSSRDEITYAEAARILARRWGYDPALVAPRHGRDAIPALRDAPLHASLDGAAADLLGIEQPDAATMMSETV